VHGGKKVDQSAHLLEQLFQHVFKVLYITGLWEGLREVVILGSKRGSRSMLFGDLSIRYAG
jgi:hypothetical protein